MRLGLGLAALGRPGYMTVGHGEDLRDSSESAMKALCFDMLDAAFGAGIRCFDMARSYGQAERFVSEWTAARKPQGLQLSSKWGYRYTGHWQRQVDVHEVKDLSLSHFETQYQQTEALLGPLLTRYSIHSATLESGVLNDGDLLNALARLRNQGLHVGLTTTGLRQSEIIDAALDIEFDGKPLFGAVQSTWNVLEPSAGAALQRAHERGLHVTIKEALANGRLAQRSDVAAWVQYCASRCESPDAVGLAAALQQPWADCVLCGAVTLNQLRSNLAAIDIVTPVDFLPVSSSASYWQQRQQLKWQ